MFFFFVFIVISKIQNKYQIEKEYTTINFILLSGGKFINEIHKNFNVYLYFRTINTICY
jgi:hypothetical protein